jgi:hypothetical protein
MTPELIRPSNWHAYALGSIQDGRFHVRKIVWGESLAQEERRDGEEIRAASIKVGKTIHPIRNEKTGKAKA